MAANCFALLLAKEGEALVHGAGDVKRAAGRERVGEPGDRGGVGRVLAHAHSSSSKVVVVAAVTVIDNVDDATTLGHARIPIALSSSSSSANALRGILALVMLHRVLAKEALLLE